MSEIKTIGCAKCPLLSKSQTGLFWCNGTQENIAPPGKLEIDEIHTKHPSIPPPDECPLRKEPITVKLLVATCQLPQSKERGL